MMSASCRRHALVSLGGHEQAARDQVGGEPENVIRELAGAYVVRVEESTRRLFERLAAGKVVERVGRDVAQAIVLAGSQVENDELGVEPLPMDMFWGSKCLGGCHGRAPEVGRFAMHWAMVWAILSREPSECGRRSRKTGARAARRSRTSKSASVEES